MNLEELRTEIDNIDDEIVESLARRFEVVKHIGQIKKEQELTPYQPEREETILGKLKKKARESGIEDKFIDDLYETIFAESKKLQEENAKRI